MDQDQLGSSVRLGVVEFLHGRLEWSGGDTQSGEPTSPIRVGRIGLMEVWCLLGYPLVPVEVEVSGGGLVNSTFSRSSTA